MPSIGQVWRHTRYYAEVDTGELMPKYLLVLGVYADGDVIYRLLTSKAHGRPTTPPCYHGDPLPGYFLGIPEPQGGHLIKETWLDLRECEDFDARDFAKLEASNTLTLVLSLPVETVCAALSCAANAADTTRRQNSALLDAKTKLGCRD